MLRPGNPPLRAEDDQVAAEFVVDADGRIAWADVGATAAHLPDRARILAALGLPS
jgi:hypothetical protein